jgi:hypothetical protein
VTPKRAGPGTTIIFLAVLTAAVLIAVSYAAVQSPSPSPSDDDREDFGRVVSIERMVRSLSYGITIYKITFDDGVTCYSSYYRGGLSCQPTGERK